MSIQNDDRTAELLSQMLKRLDRLERTVELGVSQILEQMDRLEERVKDQQKELDDFDRRLERMEELLGPRRT